jgi:hypothetical protein
VIFGKESVDPRFGDLRAHPPVLLPVLTASVANNNRITATMTWNTANDTANGIDGYELRRQRTDPAGGVMTIHLNSAQASHRFNAGLAVGRNQLWLVKKRGTQVAIESARVDFT